MASDSGLSAESRVIRGGQAGSLGRSLGRNSRATILRAAEQRAGGGPWGAPKKRPWTAIRGDRDSGPRPRTHCQTNIAAAEQPAGEGPLGAPIKRPWTAIRGGAR